MKNIKRWRVAAIFTLILLLSLGISGVAAYASDNITVIVDGTEVIFEQEPVLVDGRVIAPVRPIAEFLGWNVEIGPYGIYLKKTGDLEVIPGRMYYTYYKSAIGLVEGEQHIRHYDTIGGFSLHHYSHGHFPTKDFEICPGERSCNLLDEDERYLLTVIPVTINDTVFMGLRDLAAALYADIEWDGITRILTISSLPLPYYDGEGLPDEYRDWLLHRTFEVYKPQGV